MLSTQRVQKSKSPLLSEYTLDSLLGRQQNTKEKFSC